MHRLNGERGGGRVSVFLTVASWMPDVPVLPESAMLVARHQKAVRAGHELLVAPRGVTHLVFRRVVGLPAEADRVRLQWRSPHFRVTSRGGDVGRAEEDDEPGEREEGDYPRRDLGDAEEQADGAVRV